MKAVDRVGIIRTTTYKERDHTPKENPWSLAVGRSTLVAGGRRGGSSQAAAETGVGKLRTGGIQRQGKKRKGGSGLDSRGTGGVSPEPATPKSQRAEARQKMEDQPHGSEENGGRRLTKVQGKKSPRHRKESRTRRVRTAGNLTPKKCSALYGRVTDGPGRMHDKLKREGKQHPKLTRGQGKGGLRRVGQPLGFLSLQQKRTYTSREFKGFSKRLKGLVYF